MPTSRFISILSTGLVLGPAACFDVTIEDGGPAVAGSSGTDASTGMVPTTAGPDAASEAATMVASGGTTTEGADSGDSGEDAPPLCGNGLVEAGEACDDGSGNGDDQACTASCQEAACGDGHVQASNQEDCDNGPLNVPMPGYDQCSVTCTKGAHCGDGVLQPEHGEDCEADEGESDNCTSACVYQARYVFLTSVATDAELGGIAGADGLCNMLVADSPALAGTYRAWLLVDGQSLMSRFPEFAGVSAWNFVNVEGDVLAKSFTGLVSDGPAYPIFYSEAGDVMAETFVWTNITSAGQAAGGDCAQWTGAGNSALVGLSGYDPDEGPMATEWHAERWWTNFDELKVPCNFLFPHLYCVQVAG